MNWHIYTIGKTRLAYAKTGIEEYALRLQRFVKINFHALKVGSREMESRELLQRSEGMFRITMDERGSLIRSVDLATRLSDWENSSLPNIAILIGGSEGHSEILRKESDWLWSLSPLTLQHELALLVTMEQIYRAYCIKSGHPYHREG